MKNWRLWLGLAVSVGFIALALRGQDLGQVRRALGEADYRFLPPALVLYFAGVWVRALRWQALLSPVRRLSVRTLFPIVVIGYMANNILPWRIGEFVRGYVLRERAGIATSASLATIAVEWICDGLTMLAFLLFASLFVPLDDELRRIAWGAATVFGILLLVLIAIVASDALRGRLLALIARPLPAALAGRLVGLVESFVGGLRILRSGRAGERRRLVAPRLGAGERDVPHDRPGLPAAARPAGGVADHRRRQSGDADPFHPWLHRCLRDRRRDRCRRPVGV